MSKSSPATILVVDDEVRVRDMLLELLAPEGYKIITADDGKEAMDIVLKSKPDLILLDIRMPRLDGITFCKALRLDREARTIPVIIVTAFNTRDRLEEAMAAGADDFIGKPFDVTELKIRIRAMLKLKHISDEVERLQQYILTLRREHGRPPD
jgi:DNA-binding response OmpR family regulator